MYVGTVKRPCVSVHGDGYTRTVRYEVTFVKRENVIVKTKLSLS